MDRIRPAISDTWYTRLCRGIERARVVTGLNQLPTVLSHGDFTPWNIRIGSDNRRIALLDWENGHTDRLLLWDAFHFTTQVGLLIRRPWSSERIATVLNDPAIVRLASTLNLTADQIHGLYTAYLVDASTQWIEDYWLRNDRDAINGALQELRGVLLDRLAAGRFAGLQVPSSVEHGAKP